MDAAKLARKMEDMSNWLNALNRSVEHSPWNRDQAAEQALATLQSTVEELNVAQEEIIQQNEELQKARQNLEAERQRYQELFDAAPDGYIVTDMMGMILEANRAAGAMLGVRNDRLCGKPLANSVLLDDRRDFRAALIRLVGSTGTQVIQSRLSGHDGEPIVVDMSVSIVRDRNLKPVALRWLLRDVTERRRAEEALRQMNDELDRRVRERTSELAETNRALREEVEQRKRVEERVNQLNDQLRWSVIETHHRVKNNLQVIGAMIDMRLMDDETSVPAEDLKRISTCTRTLAAIHDILTQEGKDEGAMHRISSLTMLAQLLPLLQQIASDRKLTMPRVDDLSLSLRQGTSLALLVSELVNNAVKHGGKRVSISLSTHDDMAELEVCDDGPGFPEPFDARKAGHTGLELIENLSRWDLQGNTAYENLPEGGARVRVRFKVDGR